MNQEKLLKELNRIAKEYSRHHPWDGIHTICEAAIEEINRLSEKDRSEQIQTPEKDSPSDRERFEVYPYYESIEEELMQKAIDSINTKHGEALKDIETLSPEDVEQAKYGELLPYNSPDNIRIISQLTDEIDLLEAECDGYRRQICRLESVRPEGGWGDTTSGTTPEAIARKYGWDCYEKEE